MSMPADLLQTEPGLAVLRMAALLAEDDAVAVDVPARGDALVARLAQLGFAEPQRVAEQIAGWCDGRIRCLVISTSPKGLVRRIFVRARSRFIASWSAFSTLRRYFSFRMSMKSLTITPPRSRSRSWRAISLAAIRFIW